MAGPKITDTGLALREFLGAFINDRKQNADGKIFYNHITGRNQEDLFLESYGKLYRAKERRKVRLKLTGISKEMIGKDIIEFEYPYLGEGENINRKFTSDIIISWAVKNNFMDDEMVALFKGLVMQNFNIIYSEKGHYVGLQVRDKALDIEIKLDELLEREIEQGYYNKIIGDKNRKYGYTHMLRRNVEITLQSWQKKILFNWKQFNMIAGSRRIGKCELGSNLIMLSDGSYKRADELNLEDKLMGSYYSSQGISNLEKYNKECVEIELDNGMKQIVTLDHRVPTSLNYKNGIWDVNTNIEYYKNAKDLTKRDFVAVQLNIQDSGIEDYSKEDILLYGYFLGDGVNGNNNITGNHKRLESICSNFYKDKGNSYVYNFKGYKQRVGLEGLGLAKNKFIDNRIFKQSINLKWSFIDGILNTDSYLFIHGGKNNRKISSGIEYCSVSEKLIDGLQSILYQLGVICYKTKKKIRSNFNSNNEFGYYLYITNKESLQLIDSKIDLSNKKNYKIFKEYLLSDGYTNYSIGLIPLDSKKYITNSSRENKLHGYSYQRNKVGNNFKGVESYLKYSWHKIKSIRNVGYKEVIGIQVDSDNELYWSNNILTHNTFTSAFVAYRELYKIGGGYGARERQILYACVSEDKMWQPLQYLKLLMKKDIEHGYIKVSGKEFTNTITNAKLIFVTAGSKSGARSYGADLVIIDEAAEIPDSYWLDLLPIIMQENASVFAISTINEDSQDGWFYRELLKGELTGDEDYNTIRVTIDDNELLDDKAKQATKDKIFEASQMKYWTELYCIFPNSKSVFKLSGVIQPPEITTESNRYVVIGYDPGKINDSAGIVVVDMNTLRAIEEIELKNYQYKDQLTVLKELKEKYKNSTVVMDRTGVGEAVFEIVAPCIDVSIKYKKSGGDINYNQTHNYYNVPKKDLVETMQIYMESRGLKVDSTLEELIIQMKGFKKFQAGAYVQYGGVGVKDDLVNGLLLCGFYMKHIKGIDKKNQVQSNKDISKFLDNFNGQDIFDDYTESSTFTKYIY